MNTGKAVLIMVTVAVLALSGCTTVPVQELSDTYEAPILSAADAKSMIRVNVVPIEAVTVEETVVVAAR